MRVETLQRLYRPWLFYNDDLSVPSMRVETLQPPTFARSAPSGKLSVPSMRVETLQLTQKMLAFVVA